MSFLRGKGRAPAGRKAGRWLALFLLAGRALPSAAQESAFGLERVLSEPHTPPELRRHLAALDAGAIPFLFRLAATGVLPAAEGGLELAESDRRIVRESLGARPRRELIGFLSDRAGTALEVSERLEGQLLLASVGTSDHLKLLVRWSVPAEERGGLAPDLRLGFVRTLTAILARDPIAVAHLPALFGESPPGLASAVIEGLASQRSSEATRTLATLLGRAPGLDPLVLARLAKRGRLGSPAGEQVFGSVRRYLTHRDPLLVAAAALAAGQLGDDGAVESLLGLTEHEDGHVRGSAFDALARISGLDLGHDPAPWASWYQAESRWWDEEAESLLIRIERGHGLEFVRAARAALQHRLFRDRIAAAFAAALGNARGDEVTIACRALEQLGSTVAVPSLVECLERPDPQMRQSAWKALRAITGAELPPDPDSWAEFEG